jgi:hypothetical protein
MSAKRAVIAIVAVAGVYLACQNSEFQLFIAGQYDPQLDCVYPGTAIDVLNGAPVDAACEATCIVPMFDSGVYVTGACPPFPEGDLVNPNIPECLKAVAAIKRSDLCLDSGPSNPAVDAGLHPPIGQADAGAVKEAGKD